MHIRKIRRQAFSGAAPELPRRLAPEPRTFLGSKLVRGLFDALLYALLPAFHPELFLRFGKHVK